jgi:UDP-N-acetyl-D-galactosamine dehydrogenase
VHKATAAGYIPDVIRTAREINDGMARNAVTRLTKKMILSDIPVKNAKVLIVGVTFKENCPDIRNTKVIDLVAHLEGYGMSVDLVDTWANPQEVLEEYNVSINTSLPVEREYDAVVLAVPHEDIVSDGPAQLRGILKKNGVLFDLKAAFDIQDSDLRL